MSSRLRFAAALLLLLVGPAAADADPGAPGAATEAVPMPDFDLFADQPTAPAPAAASLDRPAKLRRDMLSLHQALGLTTLGLMAATTVAGQLNYNDIYAPGHAGTGLYIWPHRLLAYGTTGAFAATASLALFAPEKQAEHEGVDTSTIHKVFVGGATLGMLTQIGLGFVTARYAEAGNPRDLRKLAQAHQIAGYATTGMLAAAATVWVF